MMAEAAVANEFCSPSIVRFLSECSADDLLEGFDLEAPVSDAPVPDPDAATTATPITALPLVSSPPRAAASEPLTVATSADLQHFIDKNTNTNTKKNTVTWVNRFDRWTGAFHNSWTKFHRKSWTEFCSNVLQSSGRKVVESMSQEVYERCLLPWIVFLREKGCSHSILKDKAFDGCRKLLNGKAIELREMGKGKKKNKADALTETEEEQLWSRRALGDSSPRTLNYTIFFILSQQFGTRGCQEHHQICIEHLKFVCNPNGKVLFVEWVEGITKTDQTRGAEQDRTMPSTEDVFSRE